ncbi:hypothetical protein D3C78_1718220 [compost metagenome]
MSAVAITIANIGPLVAVAMAEGRIKAREIAYSALVTVGFLQIIWLVAMVAMRHKL